MPHRSIPYPSRYPGELLVAFARDLLDATQRLERAGQRAGADVVHAGPAGRGIVWLRHPDLVRAVLVDENSGVTKARGLRLAQAILGLGLLTLEEPEHGPRRRLVLPAFHHQRLQAYADVMVAQTQAETATWGNQPFDLAASMGRLALAIASQTLFGADLDRQRITDAVAQGQRAFDGAQHPLGELFARLPVPNTLRTRRARAAIDAEVYRVIAERRGAGDDGSLLDLLLAARDEDSGAGLSDGEVRDEAVTLLLAGHETTAVALSWAWPLIAGHPEVEARLHAEADALGGPPGFDDLARLPYARQVLAETMRLYPPAWVIGRQAGRDLDLDGVAIAQGSTVLLPPLTIQRDPRFWDRPERFDPDRFAPERKAGRHKFAYFPFSAGRRGCIGEQFAWTEGVLILATVAQRWRVRLAGPLPPPIGSVTLRPSAPIPVRAERR